MPPGMVLVNFSYTSNHSHYKHKLIRSMQQKDIFEILPQAIATLKKNIFIPFFGFNRIKEYANEKAPFRSELLAEDQLEQHAINLAHSHTLVKEEPAENLLKRLAENEDVLLDVHGMLTQSVKQNHRVVPAGEWLLDNFYLIEEQVYTGKKTFTKRIQQRIATAYKRRLCRLSKGVQYCR